MHHFYLISSFVQDMIVSLTSQMSGKREMISEKDRHIEILEKQLEEYTQTNTDLVTQNNVLNKQKTDLSAQHEGQIFTCENQIHKLRAQVTNMICEAK
jgi:chromosome segregation ATPase